MPKVRAFEVSPLPFEVLASLETLGYRIAQARKERGLSQRELAGLMGVSPQTALFVEQGRPTVQIGHYARAAWLLELGDVPLLSLLAPSYGTEA
ncbi:MAG: helix-turn-helix domain-containing protein [Zoogloea sp.]|uniref:helix-turn-helix domain-containing protein n=1 Tax=Zoogloea sp. TaxID=49181 RepID=UPI003F36C743|nr:helix-turn-helix domain-containing protein [Rhodocyclales bacterium]